MRTRDEVLREFDLHTIDPNGEESQQVFALADRIRALESQQAASEPVACRDGRCIKRPYCRSECTLRTSAMPSPPPSPAPPRQRGGASTTIGDTP